MKIYSDITELIGNTPLVEMKNIESSENLDAKIFAKLEMFNPAGSAKDRIALQMINDAEKAEILKKGATIIEPTSGNTGIGLAFVGMTKGYKVILTMPDSMSVERINLLKAYGAEIVLTPAKDGMNGSVKKAEELKSEYNNAVILGQFYNPSNPKAHYMTTGPEIYRDTDGTVDYIVAGIGTGGTLCGTAKLLKEKKLSVKAVAVEPASSPVISKGISGAHKIQGIGAIFVPENYDSSVVDEVMTVTDEDSMIYGRKIVNEGFICGISSGAALAAAVRLAKRPENKNKNIVVIFTDTGERYLSTELFQNLTEE